MYRRVHTHNRGIWAGLSAPAIAEMAGTSKSTMYRMLKAASKEKTLTLDDIGKIVHKCRRDPIETKEDMDSFMQSMREILE